MKQSRRCTKTDSLFASGISRESADKLLEKTFLRGAMSGTWSVVQTPPNLNQYFENPGSQSTPSPKKAVQSPHSFAWKNLSKLSEDLDQASFDSSLKEVFISGQKIPLDILIDRIYKQKMSLKTFAKTRDSLKYDELLSENLNKIEKENARIYWSIAKKFQDLLNSRPVCSLARISLLFTKCCGKKDPFRMKEREIISDASLEDNLEYILFSDSDD